jgi:putative membrane protein
MGAAPPIDPHTILGDWQVSAFPIGVAVALLAVAGWYIWSVRVLSSRGRRWPRWRTVSFLAGLLAVEVALGSSVATLSMYTFTSHVIQHLLLMVVAPPLGALGAPMTLLLQTSRRKTKRRVLKALHSRPFALLRHPILVFFLYYLSMYAFFLSSLLGYAMEHMWLMDLINLGFLGGATLFWWPMVGVDPIPGGRMHPGLKLLNLLIGVPVESFLGVAILMKTTPVASMYSLASTHSGGAILWILTELATVAALAPIYSEWTKSDARTAKRIDEALDAGTYQPPVADGYGLGAVFRSIRR